jgi:hypothetical protein
VIFPLDVSKAQKRGRTITVLKNAIAIASICLLPSIASAQNMGGYLEGNLGAAFISDIDASVDVPDLSAMATADYGTEFLFGVEGGIRGLGNARNLRLGVSWDHAKAKLDPINISGTSLSGPFSFSGSCPDPDDFCSYADESVNVVSLNAYLDLALGNDMGI